jgi:3'-phosphoadenosine 5'-phosphosulfate sulfotransferase (PAPS reductase)/FAD synthetase
VCTFVDQLVRERKRRRHDRMLLINGVRRHESRRRMGNVIDIQRRGSQVWVAPCIEWTSADKEAYIAEHNLPRNPVVDAIGMSGECLCGSFASPGELEEVGEHFPATRALIDSIAAACAERGVHAQWGKRPTKVDRHTLPLCFNCDRRSPA